MLPSFTLHFQVVYKTDISLGYSIYFKTLSTLNLTIPITQWLVPQVSRDIPALFSSKPLDGLGFGWSVSTNLTKWKEAHLRLVRSWGWAPGWRTGTVLRYVVLGRDLLGHDTLSVLFITQNGWSECWALSTCVLVCSWNKKYSSIGTGQLSFAKEQHCYIRKKTLVYRVLHALSRQHCVIDKFLLLSDL